MEQQRNELMKKLEVDVEQKVIQLVSKNKNTIQSNSTEQTNHMVDSLQNIMKDGSNEFFQKMGRNPTYSEMREMYG
jgi:hypothetical protein|uniref:Uncharacterized protein n=1 Tax=viral metagenome TaxID=1070528 RepID=A0A6C0IC81_9ZZZZ